MLARAAGTSRIELAWTASPAPGVEGYWVYGDDGTVGTQFRRLAWITDTTFTDTGLHPGFLYIYYVRAAVGAAESRASNLAGVITLPQPTPSPTPSPSPTREPTVTATPSPTATRTPAPSATTVPGRLLTLSVNTYRRYVDDFGELRIVGEVQNDFDVNAQSVLVTATLYDPQGQRLDQMTVPTLIRFVRAGGRVPFLFLRPVPKGFYTYTLSATGLSTAESPPTDLVVAEKKQYEDQVGLYHVDGRVRNQGRGAYDRVRVAVTIYNAGGSVINTEVANTSPARLEPGAEGTFQITVLQFPGAVRYTVQVEGEP